jgi:hypothetical protein
MGHLNEEEYEDAITDIAYTIGYEAATEWGLQLHEPQTAPRA